MLASTLYADDTQTKIRERFNGKMLLYIKLVRGSEKMLFDGDDKI